MNSKTGIRDKHPFVYPSRDQAQRYRRELQDAVEAVRERRFPHRGCTGLASGARPRHRGRTSAPGEHAQAAAPSGTHGG